MKLLPPAPPSSLLLAAVIFTGSFNSASALTNIKKTEAEHLAPHRAVYDLKLEKSLNSANLTDANGRMVFEVTGSKCEGYLVSMRFLLSVLDTKGTTNLTDVRSSSWEDGGAQRFRFNTSQYYNQKLSKTTIGDAARQQKGLGIKVKIKSPKQGSAKFKEKTYFPTEHTKLVIDYAIEGKKFLNAPIYDGSENGNTLYDTTTFIGKEYKEDKFVLTSKIKNLDQLKGMKSWPVAMSFFDTKKSTKQDLLPDYEISFRLYKNGVSRELLIDYGDFSLTGELKNIEFFPQTKCD